MAITLGGLVEQANTIKELVAKLRDDAARAAKVMSASELSAVREVLDEVHADNMQASKDLDALLAEAEKR